VYDIQISGFKVGNELSNWNEIYIVLHHTNLRLSCLPDVHFACWIVVIRFTTTEYIGGLDYEIVNTAFSNSVREKKALLLASHPY
jgi:hypothetical protein